MLKNTQVKPNNRLPFNSSNQFFKKLNWKLLTWLAWLACLLSLIFTPTGLWLEKLNTPYLDLLKIAIHPLQAVIAVTFPLIGALIITFKPTQPVGWLLSVGGFLQAVAWVSRQYALYSLLTNPGAFPASTLVGWCYLWSWMTGFIVLPLAILFFPTGKLPSSHWRWLVWLNLVGGGLIVIPVAVLSWQVRGVRSLSMKPNELGSALILTFLGVALMLIVVAGAIISLLVRFRKSKGEEQLQLKWFTYAVTLATSTGAINAIADVIHDRFFLDVTSAITYVTFSAVPASIAIAILKYRLFDIDLVINRTLVYALLTFGLGSLYVVIVSLFGFFLQVQSDLVVAFFATILIAILFQPLYAQIQRMVNRLMYGERDEPYKVLSRLGQRLEATLVTERVLPAIVETVAHALKLPYAAIVLPAQGKEAEYIAASYGISGSGSTQTTDLLLSYQHEPVGKLVLAPRAPGEVFNPADQHLLADLVRQIGVAVHAVQLTLDLKASALTLQQAREQLVTTREEERRHLRRNLHDGLGPSLATLSLKAEAARDLIYNEPAESFRLMNELSTQAQTSIADIRRLVYDLRPPALDDLGLIGAIQSQLAKFGEARLKLHLSVPEKLPPLPAAVEVATYRIIQEALTNVVRHAAAHNCWISLELAESLAITVRDDGQGLPAQFHKGVGLGSMHERAEELSGSCRVENLAQGGVTIHVTLPLPLVENQPEPRLKLDAVAGVS